MMVLLSKSTIAIPLFSCKLMKAVLESSETAMYSGSTSCSSVAPGPKTLKSFPGFVNPVKSTCVTTPVAISTIVIEPSGSTS
ncbi:hypothetical protein Q4595_07800 [Wenyingzhuangia sp. 1_MG-2023]|nr:hypothetical protein [Wenyingzhuangia sp. 1_MG-2023]